MQLGKIQRLKVVKQVDFGVYLAEAERPEERVLLPRRQVPEGTQTGDEVEVGCGSVLNPGTVIGKNSNIYPLSSVRGVVASNSIYKKQGEVAEKR